MNLRPRPDPTVEVEVAEPGDWNLSQSAKIELRKMLKKRNSSMPEWAKWLLLIVSGASAGSGGVAAFVPFEGKGDAQTAHTALQKQIDTLKTEIPAAVVEALRASGALRRK